MVDGDARECGMIVHTKILRCHRTHTQTHTHTHTLACLNNLCFCQREEEEEGNLQAA